MKYTVLGTMKYKLAASILFLLMTLSCFAQNRLEREHRIKKTAFPLVESDHIPSGAKRIRYYKEVDSSSTMYIIKFKKDRLFYRMDYNEDRKLQNMGFQIKSVDVPRDAYAKILSVLDRTFDRPKIKKMLQQYPIVDSEAMDVTVKNALQNLLLPHILYKLTVVGKQNGKRSEQVVLFDAEGNLRSIRKALPVNYDHVLY